MVKQVRGNTDLVLEADPGEAFLVKGIYIYNPATNYATITIAKTTVGYFRVGGTLGNHLALPIGQIEYQNDFATAADAYRIEKYGLTTNLLGFIIKQGWMDGYRVAEGEKLTITGVKQAGAIQIVVYEVWDPADISKTDPNGSEAKEYLYINYGRTAAAVNTTGDTEYTVSQSPVELIAFPFGADVPAKTTIQVLGIAASDFAPNENDGTNYTLTNYLKLVRERITLFDEDKNGILMESLASTVNGTTDLVGAGQSLIGNCSDVDRRPPFILPTPLTLGAGEELAVYLTTTQTGTGQNIAVDESEVAFIQKVTKE